MKLSPVKDLRASLHVNPGLTIDVDRYLIDRQNVLALNWHMQIVLLTS